MPMNLCRWLLSGTISETRLRWDKSLQRLMIQRLTMMKVGAAASPPMQPYQGYNHTLLLQFGLLYSKAILWHLNRHGLPSAN